MGGSGDVQRVGLWLIGARGSVATTTACGLTALQCGLVRPVGCVSERLGLADGVLPSWSEIVVGGHDVVDQPLAKRAERLADAGVVPPHLLPAIGSGLDAIDAEVRLGYHPPSHHGPLADAVARLRDDIASFRDRHRLARVVVVNVSASEPPLVDVEAHDDLDVLDRALGDADRVVLPPSCVAAYAALSAGCPYVDFTASPGIRLPALQELARRRRLPYAGSDGKTGETLLRSVLAPMFVTRALEVRSWSGTNLLGGGDGANLADPARAKGKLDAKRLAVAALLGDGVCSPTHIDNVPDLGEQKVAWDHVSFEGFLGARMSLQLTWSGFDSALAAPLVLDLARLTAAAHAAGATGPLAALALFFKDPIGCTEHRFAEQARMLTEWAGALGAPR